MQAVTFTLEQLADKLAVSYRGDPDTQVTAIAAIETAGQGDLTFLHHTSYAKYLATTKASVVILNENAAASYSGAVLITADPYQTYAQAAMLFSADETVAAGVHPTAIIGEHCDIHPSVSIGPYVVIGDHVIIERDVQIGAGTTLGRDVKIGEKSVLFPRVCVYKQVTIGQGVRIHCGVVLGSDGFGLNKVKGEWARIPQLGRVIIGDQVDIGANTTIDRGALGDTVIGNGVKLDNQIQIAHNVEIGEHTAIAGCVGIAGSAKLGKHCMIGGGTCIAGHISIADQVIITGMTQVTKSISKPGIYSSGTGIQNNHEWHKSVVRFKQLDTIARRVNVLVKQAENGIA